MDKVCRKCDKLLGADDLVKAEVIARFIPLKSKISYALTHPTACKWIEHVQCGDPRGEFEEENEE